VGAVEGRGGGWNATKHQGKVKNEIQKFGIWGEGVCCLISESHRGTRSWTSQRGQGGVGGKGGVSGLTARATANEEPGKCCNKKRNHWGAASWLIWDGYPWG